MVTARFEAEPFGTKGLYHIVRHDNQGKHYLSSPAKGRLLKCTPSTASSMVNMLEHDPAAYHESWWFTEETVYQGGHQYPSRFDVNIAK